MPGTEAAAAVVRGLARLCGASTVDIDADDHDRAVALVSHLPHVVSALMGAQLEGGQAHHLGLAGQGLRDVTRVASSDPKLWRQIIAANTTPILELVDGLRRDLDAFQGALADGNADALEAVLRRGVAGTRAVPGKHGGPPRHFATLTVAVPDRPGALARLFADADAVGVNVEDVRIDHEVAREYGSLEVDVVESRLDELLHGLAERGWSVHR